MDKKEKEMFIRNILYCLEASLLLGIKNIPEEWDGTELRWLVAEKVKDIVLYGNKKEKRYRDFKNECLVRNL